jgi:hypothetical protein
MKKIVCLIIGSLMFSPIFGSGYTAADFDQIPSFSIQDSQTISDFLAAGEVDIEGRRWGYSFCTINGFLNSNDLLDAFKQAIPNSTLGIESARKVGREPFFTNKGFLFRLVRLTLCVKEGDKEGCGLAYPIVVSTKIDSEFAKNPLVKVTAVDSVEAIKTALNNQSGDVFEHFKKILGIQPAEEQ